MKTKRILNKAIKVANRYGYQKSRFSFRDKEDNNLVYYIKPRFFLFLAVILAFVITLGIWIGSMIFAVYHEYIKEEPIEISEIIPEVTEPQFTNEAEFDVTYYCGCSKCCGSYSDGYEEIAYGACGTQLVPYYSIAVDPTIIPLGTILYDEEGNKYEAVDTGNYIKGNRIDIFTGNHQEALQLGRQEITLYY